MTKNNIFKYKTIKNVIVFGGSSGIGLAIALKLVQEGVNVMVVSRDEDKLRKALARLRRVDNNSKLYSTNIDVSKYDDVVRAMALANKTFGRTDCIINSAGVSIHGELDKFSERDYDEVLNINLKGMFNVARASWPILKKTGSGQIVSISSASGLGGYPTGSIYCASKSGVNAFMESLAAEGKEIGIRIFNICPGQVDTPIWNSEDEIINHARHDMLKAKSIADLLWYLVNRPSDEFFPKVVIQPFKPQPNLRGRNKGPGGIYKKI